VSQQRAHSSITKTRNSFRAFFNARKPRPFWKEMQAVRQEVPSTDYALMCTVTEDNSAYPFPGLGNTFPRDAKLVPNYRFQHLRPLDLTRESALQVARINYQAQNVADALKKRLSERGEIHDTAHDSNQPSGFDTLIEDWRKYLINELDHVRKDIIQIKSQTHPGGLIQANWRTVLAPFATGSAVIADGRRLEHIKMQHRKVAALDMETFGLYFAAHESTTSMKHYFSV
jgi:hypothetical protein